MCRMVGIISQGAYPVGYELAEAPYSLLWLSGNGWQPYTGKRGPHPDGWGLAWREGGMRVEKGGKPAASDPLFTQRAQEIETDLLLAHIRLASVKDTISDANCHPFQEGDLLLAHNGSIEIDGEHPVDSARLLAFLAGHWDRTVDGLVEVIRELRAFPHTSLSFLLSDGRDLYALRQVDPKPRYLEYYTLYRKGGPGKVVVASEPLDEGPWQPLENGTLLLTRGAGGVESRRVA